MGFLSGSKFTRFPIYFPKIPVEIDLLVASNNLLSAAFFDESPPDFMLGLAELNLFSVPFGVSSIALLLGKVKRKFCEEKILL